MIKSVLRLMKKFSFMFVLYQGMYYVFLFPLINSDRITGPDPLDLSFVLYLNAFMFLIIIASLWAQEQLEYKNNGNKFLQILPIKRNEIILAKYGLAFLSVLFYVLIHMVWFALSFNNPEYLATSYANLMINASLCLVLAGLIYLGFFRFGYGKFGKITIGLWLLMVLIPLPSRIILKTKFGVGTDEIVQGITHLNPIAITIISTGCFLAIVWLTLRSSTWKISLS